MASFEGSRFSAALADRLRRYGLAVLLTGAAFFLNYVLARRLGATHFSLPFYLAILVSSWYGRLFPGLLSTALGAAGSVALSRLYSHPEVLEQPDHPLYRQSSLIVLGITISFLNNALHNARRREAAERRLIEQAARRITRLQELTTALSRALDPREVARVIIESAVPALDGALGSVVLLAGHGQDEEILTTESSQHPVIEEPGDRLAETPLRKCLRTGELIVFRSYAELLFRFPAGPGECLAQKMEAKVCLPFVFNGQVLGGLGVWFGEIRDFSQAERDFMLAIGQQCAQAVQRARLLQEERQVHREAEVANHLKDEFLRTVSHELRTPLTSILGWVKLIQDGKVAADKMAHALSVIGRNAQNQALLVNDLLDVSAIVSGKVRMELRPASLPDVIRNAADMLVPAATAKGIRLEVLAEPVATRYECDEGRLQQVVWNLLANAVKFTPEGGRVKVRLFRANQHVEIQVSDSGIGIDPRFLPHVFERFTQAEGVTKRRFGGLGLGLAIVRHLVELHGGEVGAESAGSGQGSMFWVRLPAHPSGDRVPLPLSSSASRRAETPVAETALSGVQVLLVEDDGDSREMLTMMLELGGAKVRATASATEALAALTQAGYRPDVLVSDLGMAERDGYALIRDVRALPVALGGALPALALTGFAGEVEAQRALAAGFQRHLGKPVAHGELVKAVAHLAGR